VPPYRRRCSLKRAAKTKYNDPKEPIIGNYNEHKERTLKTNPGTVIQHLSGMHRKVRLGAIEALANAKPGRKRHVVDAEQFQQVSKELVETKDALAAVGHELSLLKKRVS